MTYQNQKVKARQMVAQSNTQTDTLGVVSEVPMGEWNATTQYQKLNKIRYVSVDGIGVTLLAKKANQGVEPFVSQGWQEVWMVENYDGLVTPVGDYPDMSVGKATNAQNDGTGTNIATQFSEITSDIQGLREDVTNESHFRGMFESITALQATYPTATPNDYAYIVGGNIYIWQNDAWTDSGVSSPNTSVPASDATPLMDGAANAGTSSNYARGDHRHPSDANKVNKSGDAMTGTLSLAPLKDAISTSAANGATIDQYGNIIHKKVQTGDTWHVDEADGTQALKVVYDSGDTTIKGNYYSNGNVRMPYSKKGYGNIDNGFDTNGTSQFMQSGDGGGGTMPTTNGFYVWSAQSSVHYGCQIAMSDNGNAYFRALSAGAWKSWETFLKLDPTKLAPSTENGWTIGGDNLVINSDGVYLVSVNNSNNDMATYGSSPSIMIVRGSNILGYNNYAGITVTRGNASLVGGNLLISYNYIASAMWMAIQLQEDRAPSKVSIAQVAYKKLA